MVTFSDRSRPWGRMTMRWKTWNAATLAMAAVAVTAAVAVAVPSAMAQRNPAYEQARASGQVGEQPDGYLGFVTTPSAQVRALVSGINHKRTAAYPKGAPQGSTVQLCALNGTSVEWGKGGKGRQ